MTDQEMNITDGKMIQELRKMQAQIIHGTKFFGQVADRIEALQYSLEAAKRDTERLTLLELAFNRFYVSAFFKPPLNTLRDALDKFDHSINAGRKM